MWDLSCKDWEQRLATGRSLVPTLPLFGDAGDKAVAVFDRLRLADVPGTPTMREAAGDWFRDIVRVLFGSLDPVTKQRMIRELMLLVPKKNSKTTNGALLMLVALLLNRRPLAPMGMSAPVQDVAQIAFDAAAGAIDLDPVLQKKFHVRQHLKTIVHRETKAYLQIMTFDPAALTGPKWAAFLVDELHVISKMSKASSAIRQIRGGMLPFPEAFLAFITTQSEEAPSGVFKAELTKARAIRDGKQRGAMLPVLYEFSQAMQSRPDLWRDPANWRMVTPNDGRSITVSRLVEEFETAQTTGHSELIAWASQHLNVEVGVAIQSGAWAGADFWEQQARPRFTLDELLERCEVLTVGIDGGGLDDLLGLAVCGRDGATGEWLLWTHAWAHPIVLERRKEIAERLRDFARDGDLTLVENIGDDVEEVGSIVGHCNESGLLDKVGVDQAGIGAILDAIVAAGVPADAVVAISQGWRLNGPIKTTERKLAEGVLIHCGAPMMNWVVGNAKVEQKGNAVTITKQAAGSAKIDPLLASFSAVDLMSRNPEGRGSIDAALADPIFG